MFKIVNDYSRDGWNALVNGENGNDDVLTGNNSDFRNHAMAVPFHTVTLVANHGTQLQQSLGAQVEHRLTLQACTLIMLRENGVPYLPSRSAGVIHATFPLMLARSTP